MKKRLVAVLSLLLLVLSVSPVAQAVVPEGGYFDFTFVSSVYDPVSMTTTYTYTITAPAAGSQTVQDLSHWTLALCQTHTVVVPEPNPQKVTPGLDPTTSVDGVKFDVAQEVGTGTVTYTFVLQGQWQNDLVEFVYKAGQSNFYGEIMGPSCDPYMPPINAKILARKFYDTNGDGMQGPGELPIEGWQIQLDDLEPVYSDGIGEVTFDDLTDGTEYTVREIMAQTTVPGTWWVATTPMSGTVSATGAGSEIIFGNRCLGTMSGNGTIGYWGNKNGQALITTADLAVLSQIDPKLTSAKAVNEFLRKASATDMMVMLKAQLVAATLNSIHKTAPGTMIVTDLEGVSTLQDLLDAARHAVQYPGLYSRAELEAIKNALDLFNNNLLPMVHPNAEACGIYYPVVVETVTP